jgi:hypothetical protein
MEGQMNPKTPRSNVRRCILVVSAGLIITVLLLAQTALADLPPRPEPGPDPTGSDGSGGSQLILLVQFPTEWPWESVHWQDLQTEVQWQDPHTGAWHRVEGWQGTLDTIEIDEAGLVTGMKTWWVGASDLGTGPFRWLVYSSPGESLLATSAPFDLPDSQGASFTVVVKP